MFENSAAKEESLGYVTESENTEIKEVIDFENNKQNKAENIKFKIKEIEY